MTKRILKETTFILSAALMALLISILIPAKKEKAIGGYLNIGVVRDWYTQEIFNNLEDFYCYIKNGKDREGNTYDAKIAYEQYLNSFRCRDSYNWYIHETFPDIATTWDKMMEQLDVINQNLADGYEIGSEQINLEPLMQYASAFNAYVEEIGPDAY